MIPAAPPLPPPPARVQVVAHEFDLSLSRRSLRQGRAIVELVNFGEDGHDLRLQRDGGRKVWGTREVEPGGVAQIEGTLPAGRYRLWCSLPGHRERGMAATLVVR